MRWGFNFYPAFRGTGARVTYMSGDWREVHVKLPLNRRTRNSVGTIFDGSLYGAVDPHSMIMLIKILGPDYVVWDKASAIRFKKPGRGTLYARFVIPEEEIALIRRRLETEHSIDRVYTVALVDSDGVVHAEVDKTIDIRKKEAAR